MITDEKKFIEEFKKFVKEVRRLNERFGVGKKFGFKVMAYIHIDEVTVGKDSTLYTDVYENPFRVDLRRLVFRYPDIVQTLKRHKRRIDENAVESWVSWREFNVKNWIKRLLKDEC